jgi:hypothetical protein
MTDDVIKVEVWDVVDVAKKSKPREGLKLTNDAEILPQQEVSDLEPTVATPPLPRTGNQKVTEGSHFVGDLDARIVDVYKGTHAVILMYDPLRRWTWEYIQRELPKVPDQIPILLLANYRDQGGQRNISDQEVQDFVKDYSLLKTIVHMESSMKDCFGLKGVKAFLNIPFLKLQRQKLQEKLQWNQEELERSTLELEHICKEESDYDAYVKYIEQIRKNKGLPPQPSSTVSSSEKQSTPTQPQTESQSSQPTSQSRASSQRQERTPKQLSVSSQPQEPTLKINAYPLSSTSTTSTSTSTTSTSTSTSTSNQKSSTTTSFVQATERGRAIVTTTIESAQRPPKSQKQETEVHKSQETPIKKEEDKKDSGFFSRLFSRSDKVNKEAQRKQEEMRKKQEIEQTRDVVAHLKMLQNKKTKSTTSIDDFVAEGQIEDWLKDDNAKENKKQKPIIGSETKKDTGDDDDDVLKPNPLVAKEVDDVDVNFEPLSSARQKKIATETPSSQQHMQKDNTSKESSQQTDRTRPKLTTINSEHFSLEKNAFVDIYDFPTTPANTQTQPTSNSSHSRSSVMITHVNTEMTSKQPQPHPYPQAQQQPQPQPHHHQQQASVHLTSTLPPQATSGRNEEPALKADEADDEDPGNDNVTLLAQQSQQMSQQATAQTDDILATISLEDLSDHDTTWFEEKVAQSAHKFDFPDDSADDNNKTIDTSVFDEEDEIVRQVYANRKEDTN